MNPAINHKKANPYDVYCDNSELQDHIAQIHPSREGLFPHEIAMLLYVSFGNYTTIARKYTGIWRYTYYVYSPDGLLESLIKRGFVRECTDDEMIDHLNMQEIRSILKKHNLKPGNTKEQGRSTIRTMLTGTEVVNEYGYRYLVLTENGREALDNQDIVAGEHAELWYTFCQDTSIPKVEIDRIKVVGEIKDSVPLYELYIDTIKCTSELYLTTTQKLRLNETRVVDFDIPSRVNIMVNGEQFIYPYVLDTYQILFGTRKIIIGNKINDREVRCKCYDLDSLHLYSQETLSAEIYHNGTTYEMLFPVNQLGKSRDGVWDGTYYTYFFSVADGLADEIVNKYMIMHASVKKLQPLIPSDLTQNYCVRVHKDEDKLRELIMYLIIEHRLKKPAIMGASIHTILETMLLHSKSRIQQAIIDNTFLRNDVTFEAVRCVSQYISENPSEVISELLKVFSGYSLSYEWLTQHDTFNGFRYTKVIENKKTYDNRFRELMQKLREEGSISIRWINEFSLFKLVKAMYPETIYQFKAEWLGQQSLDIYIPSRYTAIEYQGQQHYEAVEVFGGEEGYKATIERDERKKKLCLDNGVTLLYWPYNTEVNMPNLLSFLKIER